MSIILHEDAPETLQRYSLIYFIHTRAQYSGEQPIRERTRTDAMDMADKKRRIKRIILKSIKDKFDIITCSVRLRRGLEVQGVAGNKKGEFWAEAQLLSKLHTNNG
jgi:tetrahydromethanopterin S-methyltransferase subunit F